MKTDMTRILLLLALGFVALVLGTALFQRKLLYYPSHHRVQGGLSEWRHDGRLVGYAREVPSPENVWLLLHGNAGQAGDRAYALPSFSERDSVFILEYPGYGQRPGSPSRASLNGAAREAYGILREMFPKTPVCVAGESVGSGPASTLATSPQPPDKIVLIVPFDTLARVAAHHFPDLPARLILRDRWDNIAALKGYRGQVEIFGARDDSIIPVSHARNLAHSLPGSRFHEMEGGHNDWSVKGRVAIRNP